MRRTISILVLAAATVLSCHDDSGPTAPQQQTPQLAGSWLGSVHYKAPVAFYYDEGSCPDQSVTVTISQTGMAIDGTIQAACVTAQFEATIGPSLRVAYGTATETVNGATYTATLTLNMVIANGAILRMTGTTTPFTSSTGGQRDSLVLTLGR
jgi:hypothetical protein